MIWARRDSSMGWLTRISSGASVLMVPAKTGSPACLSRGSCSPVSMASLRLACPRVMMPSAGRVAPASTRTLSPTRSVLAATSCSPSASMRVAMMGTRRARLELDSDALRLALSSSRRPSSRKKTNMVMES
ncbi:hypothetical protein D3C72_1390620 [compost metagenome]